MDYTYLYISFFIEKWKWGDQGSRITILGLDTLNVSERLTFTSLNLMEHRVIIFSSLIFQQQEISRATNHYLHLYKPWPVKTTMNSCNGGLPHTIIHQHHCRDTNALGRNKFHCFASLLPPSQLRPLPCPRSIFDRWSNSLTSIKGPTTYHNNGASTICLSAGVFQILSNKCRHRLRKIVVVRLFAIRFVLY